jgi:hypothetical protein
VHQTQRRVVPGLIAIRQRHAIDVPKCLAERAGGVLVGIVLCCAFGELDQVRNRFVTLVRATVVVSQSTRTSSTRPACN